MFNLVVLTGRLTADAELKTTPNGVSVCSFTIANEVGYGENKKTAFINVVAWRQSAEFVSKHFKKGSMIGIEGSIQTRKYQDRDGNNRTAFEVVANNVQFVDGKKDAKPSVDINPDSDPLQSFASKNSDFVEVDVNDSDLPF